MSYAVVHMQKFKAGGIRGIENHNERLKVSRTNPDIEYERSHLNKDLLGKNEKSYYMRIKERIEELNLGKAIRKDAVVTCGFICTSDRAYFEGLSQPEKDRFFQTCHEFLKNRYGERNVVASTVHYDETTPHLHYYTVPVTKDGRLSAKNIFTPKELRSLQDDFHRHMRDNGFDLQRGNPESERKHLDVEEFKIKTKYEKLMSREKELDEKEKSINSRYDAVKNDLAQKKNEITMKRNQLEIEEKKTADRIETLKQRKAKCDSVEQNLEARDRSLDFEKQKVAAMEEQLALKKSRIESEGKTLEKSIDILKTEVKTLDHQKNTLKKDLEAIKDAFEGVKDIKDVLEETEGLWDVLESGSYVSQREQLILQQDVIQAQSACIAKFAIDAVDTIISAMTPRQLSGYGMTENEINEKLSKIMGEEAYQRWKERGGNYGR